MSGPFVLVHGAWHGAWCWQPLASRLRASGHDVLTPTLTGLGHRSHLLTPDVDLTTHVDDVVAVLEYEDVHDAILVGHSYAGMVVVGAAARMPGRIARLVVVDGFVPERGEKAIDLLPPGPAAHYRDSATEQGDGWRIPPRPLERLGVTDPKMIEWLTPRLVPHPLKTYTEPSPHGASELALDATYVLCDGWATPFETMAQRAVSLHWDLERVPADHEIIATDPDALASLLDTVVQKRETV